MTKTLTAKDLVKMLMDAKEAYYAGDPIMTDEVFDSVEDDLRKVDPDNSYFDIVGAPTNAKQKFKHQIHMLSAGKSKTPEEVEAWAKKMDVSNEFLIMEPKIDGMSGTIIYEDGKLQTIASRGDGEIGQDITHIAAYMKLPKTIDIKKGRVEVRGEFYLPKKNPVTKVKLRNNAVGLINRKDHGLDDLKHVHFIAYQVIGSTMNLESYKMSWLENNGFEVIGYSLCKADEVSKSYSHYLKSLRDKWQYETDGLIFVVNDNSKWGAINKKYEVSHHNHYMIALKPPAEAKETELLNVEWSVSRQGKLIPVAIFKTVDLGGASTSRASLTCYENVIRMKLEKGDKIKVSRANDVIPYVDANISKGISQR